MHFWIFFVPQLFVTILGDEIHRQDFISSSSRIAGGSDASIGEFPYMVSLQRSPSLGGRWSHVCGGSILRTDLVLTAAHCIDDEFYTSSFRVVAGEYNLVSNDDTEQIRYLAATIRMTSFNETTLQDDFALLELKEPFSFNRYVSQIELPDQGSRPLDGTDCIATGWGLPNEDAINIPNILQKVNIPIVSDDTCKSSYGTNAIKPGMICAGYPNGGANACLGDDGGPLVLPGTNVQVGIASWATGCARPGFYGVYTQVSQYTDWIISYMNKFPPRTTSSTSISPSTTSFDQLP